jgi:hypothetical protein
VGVYKEANVMMYFIEFSQFSREDSSITEALRAQMKNDTKNSVRWAEWQADRAGPNARPDVTLINAARLDWRQLKGVLDRCSADTIVLTGRPDPLFALPTLPRVAALSELLPFMPDARSRMTPPPRERAGDGRRYGGDVDTTPMPFKALL